MSLNLRDFIDFLFSNKCLSSSKTYITECSPMFMYEMVLECLKIRKASLGIAALLEETGELAETSTSIFGFVSIIVDGVSICVLVEH